VLELERLRKPVEEPLPGAEHHRCDDDGQFVDVARGQRLADEICSGPVMYPSTEVVIPATILLIIASSSPV
jgi:hypothetical protein